MLYYYLLVVLSVEYQNRPRLVINKKESEWKKWNYMIILHFLVVIWPFGLFPRNLKKIIVSM